MNNDIKELHDFDVEKSTAGTKEEMKLFENTVKFLGGHGDTPNFYRGLYSLMFKVFAGGLAKKYDFEHLFETYAPKEFLNDKKRKKHIINDIYYSLINFGADPFEYFIYKFYDRNAESRASFLGRAGRDKYWTAFNNCPVGVDTPESLIYKNKYTTYQYYKDFYRREIVSVQKEEDFAEFDAFIKGHEDFVFKPLSQWCGAGIKHIYSKDIKDNREYFDSIIRDGGGVLEERIIQSELMSSLNPTSVQTVRIVTVRMDDETVFAPPVLRIGEKGMFVAENEIAGISALIDLKSGAVCTGGKSNRNAEMMFHPDTGTEIIGFCLPEWDKVLEMARQAAEVVPNVRYIGWDFAYTDNGWVMIEGNCREESSMSVQMLSQKGLKPFFEELYNRPEIKK